MAGSPGFPITVDDSVDMEIDMDVEVVMPKPAAVPINTGGVITLDDILAKMKLRWASKTGSIFFY